MERNCCYMIEDISDRGNSLRKGNILVNIRNLHISLKIEYREGDNMG